MGPGPLPDGSRGRLGILGRDHQIPSPPAPFHGEQLHRGAAVRQHGAPGGGDLGHLGPSALPDRLPVGAHELDPGLEEGQGSIRAPRPRRPRRRRIGLSVPVPSPPVGELRLPPDPRPRQSCRPSSASSASSAPSAPMAFPAPAPVWAVVAAATAVRGQQVDARQVQRSSIRPSRRIGARDATAGPVSPPVARASAGDVGDGRLAAAHARRRTTARGRALRDHRPHPWPAS